MGSTLSALVRKKTKKKKTVQKMKRPPHQSVYAEAGTGVVMEAVVVEAVVVEPNDDELLAALLNQQIQLKDKWQGELDKFINTATSLKTWKQWCGLYKNRFDLALAYRASNGRNFTIPHLTHLQPLLAEIKDPNFSISGFSGGRCHIHLARERLQKLKKMWATALVNHVLNRFTVLCALREDDRYITTVGNEVDISIDRALGAGVKRNHQSAVNQFLRSGLEHRLWHMDWIQRAYILCGWQTVRVVLKPGNPLTTQVQGEVDAAIVQAHQRRKRAKMNLMSLMAAGRASASMPAAALAPPPPPPPPPPPRRWQGRW